jgi:hypothetical protein
MEGAAKEAFMFALEHQLDPMKRIVSALSSGQPVIVASMTPAGMMMFTLTPEDIKTVGQTPKPQNDIIIKDTKPKDVFVRGGKYGTGRPSIVANIIRNVGMKELLTIKQLARTAATMGLTKGIQIASVERALSTPLGMEHFNKVDKGTYLRIK